MGPLSWRLVIGQRINALSLLCREKAKGYHSRLLRLLSTRSRRPPRLSRYRRLRIEPRRLSVQPRRLSVQPRRLCLHFSVFSLGDFHSGELRLLGR